jgi:hypothetical protein
LHKCQHAAIKELTRKRGIEEEAIQIFQMKETERAEYESARDAEEGEWISQIPSLDMQVKNFEDELNRVMPIFELATRTVDANKKLFDVQYKNTQAAHQAIERFDKRSILMQQLLLSVFKALYSFRKKIEDKFNVFERNASWKVFIYSLIVRH